ncbi:MAG: DNA internalization-related competence protein ComEC/Rec2 [Anaerolineae bacterium]
MRLIYVTLAWAAGILFAARFPTLIWLGFCAVFGMALVFTVRDHRYRLIMVTLVMVAAGGLRASFLPQASPVAQFNGQGGFTIEGTIIAEPDIRDDRTQFRLRSETLIRDGIPQPTRGLVLVRAPRFVEVRYQDRVRVTGSLITPAEFDTFSYADYLARRGVFSIMQETAVEVLSPAPQNSFLSRVYDLRREVQATIAAHLPEPQAGLLTGILTGNERGISPELDEAFQKVGASHVIAISGFNMVIIAGVVMGLLARLGVRGTRAAVIGIGVLTVYTVFAGANAAVVRAAIMSSLLVIAPLLKRKTYVPASLAFVALLMSFFDPNVLWDVSFQLSFFATLGLTLFTDPFQRRFDALLRALFPTNTAERISGLLAEPLIVTLAALTLTLPLTLVYFGRLSLLVLAVNVLIVPVQAYLLILGGAATLMAFVLPAAAQIFYWVDMVLLSWTVGVVRWFAAIPYAESVVYVDSRWIAAYFGGIVGFAMVNATRPNWWLRLSRLARSRPVINVIVLSGVALSVLMVAIARSRPDGQLHVWFLDTGHSNAVLMQSPAGAHILVDGGQFPSRLLTAIGDRLPFNDRELEVLFLTQPDENDTAALPALLARYETGVVITHGQPNEGEVYAQIQSVLAARRVVTVTAGYTLELDDGLRVEILHPPRTPDLSDNISENVMVLRVTYGAVSFLLTSDLSEEGQIALLEAGQWPLATVMQLPAHGAALDSAFLEAVQPQAIVLQSDQANRFGHPNPDVLSMLTAPVYRTDESGVIHMWTDGTRLWTQSG